jgi:hypothetical protein
MIDSLFARAQRAIDHSRLLQRQSKALQAEQMREREQLRTSVLESAMYRSETRAIREDREN